MARMPEIQEVLDKLDLMMVEIKAIHKKIEAAQHQTRLIGSFPSYNGPVDRRPNGL